MSAAKPDTRAQERKAKIGAWLARRASRNTGPIDRLCRRLLTRALAIDPAEDFMRDDWVDSDVGFDPDELARYQRGETEDAAGRFAPKRDY
jgi:hypothetical protein